MISEELKIKIKAHSKKENLDPFLLMAIIETESNGQTWAVRHEPKWSHFCQPHVFCRDLTISEATEKALQAMSWGLCQVMGAVARELGFKDHLTKLCLEDLNLEVGAKKIKKLTSKYSGLEDAIAAYNAGIPKVMADGKYFNQPYVNKVKFNLSQFRGKG